MRRLVIVALPVVILVCVSFLFFLWREPILNLTSQISGNNPLSYLSYVTLLVVAVVLMPVTVMPLIPVASAIFGPFTTALLSIVGWTVGATVAFILAKRFGRPFLVRFVTLEKVDAAVLALPPKVRFWGIVLLRNTLPVDIASYALGLVGGIGLGEYVLATMIGVSWFSFAFAYAGEALLTGNMPLIIELSGVSIVVFSVAWFFLYRSQQK